MVSISKAIQQADEQLGALMASDEPGLAVIVTKSGQPVFRKGYGLSNLEHNIAIEADMPFRIGSVTKVFTATAILMLADQGKLVIDEPYIRHLDNQPKHHQAITIRHLLCHSSGIENYTTIAGFHKRLREDMTVRELIDLFIEKPLRFEAGARFEYSNSNAVLLGAIIEKVSGQTYADFLLKNIFEPLGMNDTSYDDPRTIVPRRVTGYDFSEGRYVNARFVSMTQPFAGGGLLSSVDDIATFDAALCSGKLLHPDTLQLSQKQQRLNDGTLSCSGLGWFISKTERFELVQHAGGIHGFAAFLMKIPKQEIMVAMLANSTNVPNPGHLAYRVGAIFAGSPYIDPDTVSVDEDELSRYAGSYQVQEQFGIYTWEFVVEDGQLVRKAEGLPDKVFVPIAKNQFHPEGNSLNHLTFELDESSETYEMRLHNHNLGFVLTGANIRTMLPAVP